VRVADLTVTWSPHPSVPRTYLKGTTRMFASSLRPARWMAGAALAVLVAGCGSHATHRPAAHESSTGMPGMQMGSSGDGLASSSGGYQLALATASLPAGQAGTVRFRILGGDGKPVTKFTAEQTKLMHFYAIRSDLTGFQHLHPTMATDGSWSVPVAALAAGRWRLYTTFTPAEGAGKGTGYVLSRPVTVPGPASPAPLPSATAVATVDGYTLTVAGKPMTGMEHTLTVTVSRDGKPVTDLQPYLDTYAHLTAFHAGDLAFAHLHPTGTASGDHGGPTMTFHAELSKSGDWRLFLQFQTAGTVHTAALTLAVS
jgi:hypothetical protein